MRSRGACEDAGKDPGEMYERAGREISDDDFREAYIVSADPELHAERVREVERLGAPTPKSALPPARAGLVTNLEGDTL